MPIICMEGFDGGANDHNLRESTTTSSITTTAGRTGQAGVLGATGLWRYNLPSAEQTDTLNVACAVRRATSGNTTMDFIRMRSEGINHVNIRTDLDGRIYVRRGATTLFLSEPGLCPVDNSTFTHLELEAKLHDTTGTIRLWVNGGLIYSGTGLDTRDGGTKPEFDALELYGQAGYSVTAFDDVIVANEVGPIGDAAVHLLLPSGNGASSDLVGSDGNSTDNYALVDEANPAAADYVGGDTADDHDSYAYGNLPVSEGSVLAVEIRSAALKSDAGGKAFRTVHRENDVDSFGADKVLGTTLATFAQLYVENPARTSPWTVDHVNDSEFGFAVRDVA